MSSFWTVLFLVTAPGRWQLSRSDGLGSGPFTATLLALLVLPSINSRFGGSMATVEEPAP